MDQRTQQIAAAFDERAPRYGESDWHRASAERLVDLCDLKPRARVLDAGTGTGFAALHAARRVGPDGHVVGVDVSAGMLEAARAAAAAAGAANVELLRCDATALTGFADGTFDAVLSATSLIYIPVVEGLREWHRLLREGGLLGFSTMRAGFPLGARLFRSCAAEFGLSLDDPCAPLGSRDACLAAVAEAGFTSAEVFVEDVAFSTRDLDRAWESNLRSAAHDAVRALPVAALAGLERRYRTDLAAAVAADPGRLLHSTMLYVRAWR
jgi:ubiquinone/menaquinone biosynthesis C-methylase UbiE